MNEEMKEMLDIVKGMFDNLSSKVDNIQKSTEEFKAEMKADNAEIRKDISQIKMIMENETNKNINLLVEGYSAVIENTAHLKALPEKVEKLEADVSVIKDVVTGHSGEINKLAKVK